jgi:arsenite methyltransferase
LAIYRQEDPNVDAVPKFDGLAAELLETLYTSPKIVARRRLALGMLALRPGERVLDVGFGPGFFAEEMARSVGRAGHVDGIDLSESMLAMAASRCADRPTVALRLGDATELPYEAGSFDAALASQVYLYVQDTAAAFRELARVLRAGGRALVVDIDWGTLVWPASDQARMNRILSTWQTVFADPFLPRTLSQRLRAAGLVPVRSEGLAMYATDIDPYVRGVIKLIGGAVAGKDGITHDDVAGWEDDLDRRAAAGEHFFSLNQYLFLVRKPGH